MMEKWKPIPNFEDEYQASNRGRVKSLDRIVRCGANRVKTHLKGKVLKQTIGTHGYPFVGLHREGVSHIRTVHTLVWEAFNGRIPKVKEVNHKDGIKTNCRLSNLELLTHSSNMRHNFKIGVSVPTVNLGISNGRAKLNEIEVMSIRDFYLTGEYSHNELAAAFKVSSNRIYSIVHRKTWRHVA